MRLKLLNVDSLLHLHSLLYRRLYEVLSCTKLADCACLLEFSLELLESLLDAISFLYWNYNHI